jgi:imidazolonepropionase-like amidohydrolase
MAESAMAILLTGCTVVDGTDAPARRGAAVLVEGDRIAAVGPASALRGRVGVGQVVDLDGATLIPGLCNLHVHLGLTLPGAQEYANESVPELTLRMAANARAALEAGVTTVRLLGEAAGADLALRAAIGRGQVPGPRILTAGSPIGCTGGHGFGGGRLLEADGAAGFRHAARSQIKLGVDWIKIMLTGGLAGRHEQVDTPQLADDELHAVIEVAHAWGRKVTAHAGSSAAIRSAIEAGIDCIEHGYELTDEVVTLMVERSVWLVPTIVVTRSVEQLESLGVPAWMTARMLRTAEGHTRALERAVSAGVRIAAGTDMLPAEPFDGTIATVGELEHYVRAGMTPLAALQAATARAAELLGLDGELGTLEPGKSADIVGLEGDPTADISALRSIRFVMKGGVVVRDDAETHRSARVGTP